MLSDVLNQIAAASIVVLTLIFGWLGFLESKFSNEVRQTESHEVTPLENNKEETKMSESINTPSDNSVTTSSNTEPKVETEPETSTTIQLESKRPELITSAWSNIKRPIPKNLCTETDGLRFSIQSGDTWGSHDDIDIYVTDSEGGEAGHLTLSEQGQLFRVLTSKSRVWDAQQYGAVIIVGAREYSDSVVRIKNIDKENHFFNLSVQSAGGQCDFTDYLLLSFPVGAYADIPVTMSGDIGPIAWDLDGDGTYDFYESLIYEPSNEQYKLLLDFWYDLNPKEEFLTTCKDLLANQDTSANDRQTDVFIEWCKDKEF